MVLRLFQNHHCGTHNVLEAEENPQMNETIWWGVSVEVELGGKIISIYTTLLLDSNHKKVLKLLSRIPLFIQS